MTTSKSARRVLQVAYEATCRAVPAYRHRFSPKKYTQPQLLAYLVLKEFLRLDYRGLATYFAEEPDRTRQIGMRVVPHFTTFHKAAQRLLLAKPARKMFDAVLERVATGSPQVTSPAGRRRWHAVGVTTHQPVLRQAALA